MGHESSLEILKIVDNTKLEPVGNISHNVSIWSDVKVYQDFCYCVNENPYPTYIYGEPYSGVQVLSLEDLSNGGKPFLKQVINEVVLGDGTKLRLDSAHNLYIDEINAILYVIGVSKPTPTTSRGTRHPSSGYTMTMTLKPISGLDYTNDASSCCPVPIQMKNNSVNFNMKYYHDLTTYTYTHSDGTTKTIAYALGEDNGISVIDVSNPVEWIQLGFLDDYKKYLSPSYFGKYFDELDSYLHQIWPSSDGRYIFANDEFLLKNCVIVYDMQKLVDQLFTDNKINGPIGELITFTGENMIQNPPNEVQLDRGLWTNGYDSINHNFYVHHINELNCDVIFHSCYTIGLRLYKITRNDSLTTMNRIQLTEIAYYDTYPPNNNVEFAGQWSNYYFNNKQHLCIASDVEHQDFLFKIIWDKIEGYKEIDKDSTQVVEDLDINVDDHDHEHNH
jgi:hypothetical protein